MKLNTLRFLAHTLLMIWWIVRICEQLLWKQFWFFSKNFLGFRLDAIEKQSIINLCGYSGKRYVSVILSDSRVPFLVEEEDATFRPFPYCVLFINYIVQSEKYVTKIFLSSKFQWVFCQGLHFFPFFIFFNSASNYSSINYPTLMSSWLLIIFVISL